MRMIACARRACGCGFTHHRRSALSPPGLVAFRACRKRCVSSRLLVDPWVCGNRRLHETARCPAFDGLLGCKKGLRSKSKQSLRVPLPYPKFWRARSWLSRSRRLQAITNFAATLKFDKLCTLLRRSTTCRRLPRTYAHIRFFITSTSTELLIYSPGLLRHPVRGR